MLFLNKTIEAATQLKSLTNIIYKFSAKVLPLKILLIFTKFLLIYGTFVEETVSVNIFTHFFLDTRKLLAH